MVEEEAVVVDEVEVGDEGEVKVAVVVEDEAEVKVKVGVAVVEAATATHQDVRPLVRRRQLGITPHERRALLQKSQRHPR
jgi:hypothetical protein